MSGTSIIAKISMSLRKKFGPSVQDFDNLFYQQAVKAQMRPNKKKSVFPVTGLKILGRIDTHIYLIFFFWKKR